MAKVAGLLDLGQTCEHSHKASGFLDFCSLTLELCP